MEMCTGMKRTQVVSALDGPLLIRPNIWTEGQSKFPELKISPNRTVAHPAWMDDRAKSDTDAERIGSYDCEGVGLRLRLVVVV